MSAFEESIIQRIRQLEREIERLQRWERPTGGGGGVTDHGQLTGLADNDHPQYRLVSDAIDHGALTGLGDNDHPQYLLTTGKAADSDKLDGNDSSYFSPTTHNHDHDTLINFVANKHIDHSGVSITAGAGLTGGGNLTATRTIALSHLGFQSLTDPKADRVLFWDDSAGALKWLTVEGIVGTDFGKWTSWTPTQTGWTELPTGVYRYCKIGKLVMGIIYMSAGTSNSTVAELSLPFTAASNGTSMRGTTGWAMDNGVEQTQPGTWVIYGNTKIIALHKTFPTGGWTGSGTKRIVTMFFYEAA